MFDLDPNLCQLPIGSFLSFREFSSGWLFFSPGRFSSPPAPSLGIRYPCTRWPPAGRRSLPRRLSFWFIRQLRILILKEWTCVPFLELAKQLRRRKPHVHEL